MNLVVNASAVVAIIALEPEADAFVVALSSATRRIITSVNVLEARLVLSFTKSMAPETVPDFLMRERIDIIPFDEALSDLAFEAYGRYGKGRHPARLSMGDCAAYALAKARGWPLLYKGDDFAGTDIERA
ncbi:type II toxin-antitoxin system VapC family toxin [Bosea minatitlanensis]|uniref:Ribonuclease VapC n=1 Tax=Bosea minatitlanensis TaxID=128782 RepID=A0ABW0EZV1_9HYPH|nr:type II toxin-antitoxin system VapC family toxin [Bosea minatitlanensis]MCT4491997.1 type II toxin-antitoxin system VapC family toxin [Bosea minatitlanensis]